MRIKKTSQTTPVQAEVVNIYSDSQENTYSCDYINELNTYKTTEQKIGTWIDGKPLYRKVINITSYYPNGISADSQVTFQHNISNFDALINAKIIRAGSNPLEYKSLRYIQYITDNARNEFNIYASNYGMGISSNQTLYLIVEYTKTTD
jgi:hypothetical protein